MAEAEYERLTGMTFIYVSGTGTDSSEKGRVMWARIKGKTENAILRLPFQDAYAFRPAAVVPMHGERSKTAAYRILYILAAPLAPLLRRLVPGFITTTEEFARAAINVARRGFRKKILENADIKECAR